MHITFIVTGGTIFQKKDPGTGSMVIAVSLDDLVCGWLADLGVTSSTCVDLKARSGAELTYDTIFAARDAVLAHLKDAKQRSAGSAAFVLVTGTDTLEEFAFCLDLLMGAALVAESASLVVTGAMKPYDIEGYDGRCNLQQAVQVKNAGRGGTARPGRALRARAGGTGLLHEFTPLSAVHCPLFAVRCSLFAVRLLVQVAASPHAAQFGVLVTLNDDIHLARYVRKADSQLMGAFQSHPGPVGQVREGRVRFYYGPPPDAAAWRDPRLAALDAAAVRPYGSRVGIWLTGVSSGPLPEPLLTQLAGLVLAAPGTGSLSASLTDQLAAWTARLPIVIATRCGVGCNFDDHYYRGSRTKYESRGFLLAEFSHLDAVQARNLLVLRLAAGVYPQYGGLAGPAGGEGEAGVVGREGEGGVRGGPP
ncbi:hypothetical protein PLESTB_000770800 [Pleodorina starrii]|uniref:asparaginase n=1 Tax=Pleodorina starrii TaxID=330485 RepID=A0A9W6BLA0_9CHLO|nr:hypothetical protein PLESTB_000770800 [Pleodorina starrii]